MIGFNWTLYLELAKELIYNSEQTSLKEASLRTGISRAYYGVFCIARNYLERAVSVPKKEVHKFVIEYYESSSNRTMNQIGADLDRLRKARNGADYENNFQVNEFKAKVKYQLSQKILKNLKKIGAI